MFSYVLSPNAAREFGLKNARRATLENATVGKLAFRTLKKMQWGAMAVSFSLIFGGYGLLNSDQIFAHETTARPQLVICATENMSRAKTRMYR